MDTDYADAIMQLNDEVSACPRAPASARASCSDGGDRPRSFAAFQPTRWRRDDQLHVISALPHIGSGPHYISCVAGRIILRPPNTIRGKGLKFLLFSYHPLAPRGGWGDFLGCYDSQEAAQRIANQVADSDSWQIVDLSTNSVVAAGKGNP
jgi:hypothetical protein